MKKTRVPRPSRVVLQYRLVFLLLLGIGVIGLLYVPQSQEGVNLSPLADACSIRSCHDICLDDGSKRDCFCNDENCICNQPTPLCRPSLGEACRVNAVSGDAFCVRTRSP